MGYDVEITRAPWLVRAEHFPIAIHEWVALAERRADVHFHRYEETGGWFSDPADDTLNFWLVPGGGRAKSPHDELLRYMVGIAADLDARVIGQDGEIYRVDPDGGVRGEWTPPVEQWFSMHRPSLRAIPVEEWSALVAAQPDFRLLDEVEADCPSGRRWIPGPPTPHWTGNPSGRPVPFIYDGDWVSFPVERRPVDGFHLFPTVTDHGAATLARAHIIAERLGAEVED